MRGPAFVDSVVLIAAMHRRDRRHADALPIVLAADAGRIPPLVLTDFVLAETINYLTRKGGSAVGREALRRLDQSSGFRVERVSGEVWSSGRTVYERVDGRSLVDALTVAFMKRRNLTRLYSFDAGFDRVRGLERLEAA